MDRVLFFGIGGIGGYLGATAAQGRSNARLTFVARGLHLAAIRERGLRYVHPGREDACGKLAPVVGDSTVVVPILNGVDIHERVRATLKSGIVLPASTYVSASIAEPGVVTYRTGRETLVIGRGPDAGSYDPAPLREFLSLSGIGHEWYDDPRPAIWGKYLFIASFSMVTAYAGKSIGAVLADPVLAAEAASIRAEIVAVGRALGVTIGPGDAEKAEDFAKSLPYEATTSFQRDYAVPGKRHEIDIYGGAITRLGAEAGVPTPVASRIYAALLKE